ncbi:MAG: transposase [Verrucomicrobiota bacterium]
MASYSATATGAYASFARKKDQLQLAGCWAHVRRKFFEARQQDPPVAGWLLRQIRQLYRLEKKAPSFACRSRSAGRPTRAPSQICLRPAPSRTHPAQTQGTLPSAQRHG